MNTNNYEYYFDEIIKLAFQAKCEFAKDAREREELKNKIIVLSKAKTVSAVLPNKEDELLKYKGKSVKKRADGRYMARFYDKEGKQHSVYGKTQKECYNKLKKAVNQIDNGNKTIQSYTLGEWLNKWLELYKADKVKRSTLDQMQRYLKELPQNLLNKNLKKLTSIDLQSYLNSIEYPRKREKLYTFLKDALTKALKNKLIDDDLFDGIDKPKHSKKQSNALTYEEEVLFVAECKKLRQGDLFLFCLYQGVRLGEALALNYEDIDFDKKTIAINKSIDTLGELTTPKTATSNRTIPLFKNTQELLTVGNSGKIFKYDRKTYQHAMVTTCAKLGIKDISIHSLRHTFATRCSEAGIAPKVVQKWLGHSTVDMTMNIYTHVNRDFEQKEVSKIDTYFDTYAD